jgi:diguanylate cyclase (GGDEF)-like protein/PAS domain S-box-containing protein
VVDRAGWAGCVPVSLHLQDTSPAASAGYPLMAVGVEQVVLLPDSPALVCDGDVIVQANLAAARLTGRRRPELLIGLALPALLADDGTDAELIGSDGRGTPVRVTRWRIPGTDLLAVFLVDVSDLRSASDALRTERRRLAEVERVAGLGSWEFDPVTGSTRWSPGHYEILGVEPGTVVSGVDTVLGVVHPQDRDRLADTWEEHLHTGDPVDTEYRVVRPDGTTRTIRARAESQHDQWGRPVRYTGCIWDVTEARALEHELREERRRLAEAQRVARIGTWELDPETDQMVWSDMLQELVGVSLPHAPAYRTYLSLVHPDDRDWVDELWHRLASDHQPVECEHRVLRPDRKVRVLRCYGAVTAAPSGGLRIVGTAQDVTEQRATESRMERSSRRFADLVAITPVGVGIFDGTDRLVDANDALCGLLRYDLEQLRGMAFEMLTHPDERTGRRSLRSYQAGGPKSYSVPQRTLLRADGAPVYCELHVSVSVQDDGQRFLLVVFADVTERHRTAEELKYKATHDELTGLPNRLAIKDTLAELLAAPNRNLAVLCCDIDNFKRVNDSLGHDAGDELLVALARRLADGLPEHCTAGRLSGDVYVVICADVVGHGGIHNLVAAVTELLRTAVPVHGQLVRVTAAIGVAVPDTSTGTAEDLLRFADAALSQAKRQCTGQVALANPALMASADRQVELECQLREALACDALQLHYQPVVRPDGTVCTAEALIRWPHPEHGMLAPETFLPVAEQGDLLRELDLWVLRTALRQAREWVTPDGRPVAVAVNLSGLVPGEPDFVTTVATAVAESGLGWDRVVLELVETSLMDLPSRIRQAMAELVERGVRFAVDDFGTGYSSLARLKELPAQIVKVDRRFVSGVGVDPADSAVARAVVDMARAMGRCCVAEGVETATQFRVLRELGVDAYQGWLFSHPIGQPEFRTLLGLGPLAVPR